MFEDRFEAGRLLSDRIKPLIDKKTILYAIPRGGVVVAAVISKRLDLSFFLVVVKKIGAPHNPELALGAVGPQNALYLDDDLIKRVGVSESELKQLISEKRQELRVREKLFSIRYPNILSGKSVVLVDDGIATGATVRAALIFLKKKKPREIILATPVIARDTYDAFLPIFDRIVALEVSDIFGSVGQFYHDFTQVTDEDIRAFKR
ncbi:phosphoribosyltransferase [Candidatus Gottesmanbacteria bacterium]|nr:phosphoribosyltransferase [Candidatus Gottesmanbacteria bacterium]